MKIVFDTASLETFRRAFEQFPALARIEFYRFAQGATALLQGEVVERTPAAEGVLRGSIIGGVQEIPGGMLGFVGTAQPYAEAVELGTKPHMPPIAPLEQWVRTKIGLSGKRATAMARGIQWKIFHHGTKGAFMFREALQANRGAVAEQFAQAMARLRSRFEGSAQ